MATHFSILAGKSHGQRSLVGYNPWGCKELDMTQRLNNNSNCDFYSYLFNYPLCKGAKLLQSLMSPALAGWYLITIATFLSLSQGSPTSNSKTKQNKKPRKHQKTHHDRARERLLPLNKELCIPLGTGTLTSCEY